MPFTRASFTPILKHCCKIIALIHNHEANPISEDDDDVGERLILTPYLESGQIEKAKELSIVDPKMLMENITSYAGYLTVNKDYNSHLWFWYFPVQEGSVSETPLIIWLQGGPGISSMYGLFEEIGPFKVDSTGSYLTANKYSWHLTQSVLFIDNPVGTGFSITDEEGLAKNQSIVAEQLYIFLIQFYQIFPELQSAPLFIAGQSYGGKHVPSLAYEIHKNNPYADLKINLQGIAIGSGFIDPESLIGYSDFLYQVGMIDERDARILNETEEMCYNYKKNELYREATTCHFILFSQYIQMSGIENAYDIREETNFTGNYPYCKFLRRPNIQKALHVGDNLFYFQKTLILRELIEDFSKSYKHYLEDALKHYRVMLYNGQYDIIVAYPLTIKTIKNLNWSHAKEYSMAQRKKWIFGNVVAGYTKTAGNLLEVLVRNAGHSVPVTQPERALSLIQHFIRNEPLPEEFYKERGIYKGKI